MFSSKPDDTEPIFANSRGQSREVTVAADQAEPIEPAPVQQVHCVNDERAVTGIFPYRITVLLDGVDAMVGECFTPFCKLWRSEVAIDSAYGKASIAGYFFNDRRNDVWRIVVRINQ